jgi:hypothetical protein
VHPSLKSRGAGVAPAQAVLDASGLDNAFPGNVSGDVSAVNSVR